MNINNTVNDCMLQLLNRIIELLNKLKIINPSFKGSNFSSYQVKRCRDSINKVTALIYFFKS